MIVPRPTKELGNQNYAQEVEQGKLDIIDVELDDDLNELYRVVNGNIDGDNINPGSGTKIAYERLNLTGKIKTADLATGFTIPGSAIPAGSVTNAMLAPGASFWDRGDIRRQGDAILFGQFGGAPIVNYLSIPNIQCRAAPLNFIIARLYLSGGGSHGSNANAVAQILRDGVVVVDNIQGFIQGISPTDQPWTIYYEAAVVVPDTANHTYSINLPQSLANSAVLRTGNFAIWVPS